MLTTMKSFLIGTLWFSSLLLPTQALGTKEPKVNLLTAANYAILAKSGIHTIPQSHVTGDIGVSPIAATAMTGFGTPELDSSGEFMTDPTKQVIGKMFGADNGIHTPGVLVTAVLDMMAAYTDAATRPNADPSRTNIGGGYLGSTIGGVDTKLTPGVYTSTTVVSIIGDVYFEGSGFGVGEGDSDVFVIQISGDLTQVANSKVILTNGALAENVIWQVAGYVAVGVSAHMEGILLVKTKVDFLASSSLYGRIMSQTATNIAGATITQPFTFEACPTVTAKTGSTICPNTNVIDMIEVEGNALPIGLDIFSDLEFTGTPWLPTVNFKVNNPFGSEADIYVRYHKDVGEVAGAFDEDCAGDSSVGACKPTVELTSACLSPPGQTPYAIVTVFFVSNYFYLDDSFLGIGSEVDKCCHQDASTIGTPVVEYTFGIHCACPDDTSRNLRGNSEA
jgi:hypothetical protein